MLTTYQILFTHSCSEYQSSVWINKHILKSQRHLGSNSREFPGEVERRFHRRASAFATVSVALLPSFLSLYLLLAYAYFIKYDDWQKSEGRTFLVCVSLGADHALGFLATRWSTAARAFRTSRSVGSIQDPGCFRSAVVEQ